MRVGRRARHQRYLGDPSKELSASVDARFDSHYYNVAADCAARVERARDAQENLQEALEKADTGDGTYLRNLSRKMEQLVQEADETERDIPQYCRLVSHIYEPTDTWAQWAYDEARKRLPKWAGGKRRKLFGQSTKRVCGEKKCNEEFPFTTEAMERALAAQMDDHVGPGTRLAVEYGTPKTRKMSKSRGNMCQVLQHLTSKGDPESLGEYMEKTLGVNRDCPVVGEECRGIDLEALIARDVLDLSGIVNIYYGAGGKVDGFTDARNAVDSMQAKINEKHARPTQLQVAFCLGIKEYIEAQQLLLESGMYDRDLFNGDVNAEAVDFNDMIDEFKSVAGEEPVERGIDGLHLAFRAEITTLSLARQLVGRLKVLRKGAFPWDEDVDSFQRQVNEFLSDLFPGYSEDNTSGGCNGAAQGGGGTKSANVYQEMVARFFSPRTMSRLPEGPFGLLLNWSTGTGKTCAMLSIAREFVRRKGWRVIWLADPVNKNAYKKDLWCLGAGSVFPESHIFTTPQFINIFATGRGETGRRRLLAGGRSSHDLLSKTLILYDEAHKGFSNEQMFIGNPLPKARKTFNTLLKEQLRRSYENSGPDNCCRIILATATPGEPCSPMQVAQLLNMLYATDVIPEDKTNFIENYLREKEPLQGIQNFRTATKGAISYLFFMGKRFFAKVEEEHVKVFINDKDQKYLKAQQHCLSAVGPRKVTTVVAAGRRRRDDYKRDGFVVGNDEEESDDEDDDNEDDDDLSPPPPPKKTREVKSTRVKQKSSNSRSVAPKPAAKRRTSTEKSTSEKKVASSPKAVGKRRASTTAIATEAGEQEREKEKKEIKGQFARDEMNKAAACLRRASTVPRSALGIFSEAEREEFAYRLLEDASQSQVANAILRKIEELDAHTMKTEGKLYKHVIYSELGNQGWGEFMLDVLMAAGATGLCYESYMERDVSDKATITFKNKKAEKVKLEAIKKEKEDKVDEDKKKKKKKVIRVPQDLIKGNAIVLRKMTTSSHGECNKNRQLKPSGPAAITKALFERINSRANNVYGEEVRFIILDRLKESVDIFDAGFMHIVEPPLNDADRLQLVGRVRRYCGQTGLGVQQDGGFRPVTALFYEPVFTYAIEVGQGLRFVGIPEEHIPCHYGVDTSDKAVAEFGKWKKDKNVLTIPEFIKEYARKEDSVCDEVFYDRIIELLRLSAFDRDLLVAYNGCVPKQRSMDLLWPVDGTVLPPDNEIHESCRVPQ